MNHRRFFALLLSAWLPATLASASMNVLIEATAAKTITPPMLLVNAAAPGADAAKTIKGAANDTYLTIPLGAGKPPEVGGDASFEFEVDQAATYILWARVWWTDGCSNSLFMSINGAQFAFGQDATYRQWHWVKATGRLPQLDLKKGKHTLTISNREDGVAIDQILLTRNRRYVPVGIEKP